jgi:hypothetical protein
MVVSAAALCAAGVRWVAARSTPVRVVKAPGAQLFPGRLRPFDEVEARKEGTWVG